MIKDLKIDKYNYLRGDFTAQSNIDGGPFSRKNQQLEVVNYFGRCSFEL